MRRIISEFVAAVRFLTVFPLPEFRRSAATGVPLSTPSTWAFPIVGLLIGLALVGVSALLPASGLIAPALLLAFWTMATGGLHEDGWVDCADAALAPVDRARRVEILKDPHVGAHGLTALVLLMLVRFAALVDVRAWVLVAAPVIGRWAMVLSLAWARPLRSGGLGASLARAARPLWASLVAGLCLVATAAVASPASVSSALGGLILAVVAGGVSALAVAAFLASRFGGLSGDGHGAVGLAAESGSLGSLALIANGWLAGILQ